MKTESLKIVAGGFFHETHAFSPRRTTATAFTWIEGPELISKMQGAGTTLGGIVSELTQRGHTAIPALFAEAAPGGPVDEDVYENLVARFKTSIASTLDQFGRIDGIALELHGAMATASIGDVEGHFLKLLRAWVGEDVPIAVGLDLHCHLTADMLTAADIVSACKENPHRDVMDCGRRCVQLLEAAIRKKIRPVSVLTKARMILPGNADTSSGPLQALHEQARQMLHQHPAILDISLLNVFPYANGQAMGQGALVIADGDAVLAAKLSAKLAGDFWLRRDEFLDTLPTTEAALDTVQESPKERPFLLADMGDRVLAGAPGDSIEILRHAQQRQRPLRGAVTVTDAVAVQDAHALGVGARFVARLGGIDTPGLSSLETAVEVIALGPGSYVVSGPYKQGTLIQLGLTATLRMPDGSVVIATSQPGLIHDPQGFRSHGVEPNEFDFVGIKSGYHFKLNFAGIGTALAVATPGLSIYAPRRFAWSDSRIWPEHDVTAEPILGPWRSVDRFA